MLPSRKRRRKIRKVSILVLVDVPLEFFLFYVCVYTIPVSILVLVDVPLEYDSWGLVSRWFVGVSILVLVDVPLEYLRHRCYSWTNWFQSLF